MKSESLWLFPPCVTTTVESTFFPPHHTLTWISRWLRNSKWHKAKAVVNWHEGKQNFIDATCETRPGGHFGKAWGRASLGGILRREKHLIWSGKDVHQLKRWLGEMNPHHLDVQRINYQFTVSYTLNIIFIHIWKISVPKATMGPSQHIHPLLQKRHWT